MVVAIQNRLFSRNCNMFKTIIEEYLKLVDRFNGENADLIASQQNEAAAGKIL